MVGLRVLELGFGGLGLRGLRMVEGLGFGVAGLGLRVEGLGLRVELRVQGIDLRVESAGFSI